MRKPKIQPEFKNTFTTFATDEEFNLHELLTLSRFNKDIPPVFSTSNPEYDTLALDYAGLRTKITQLEKKAEAIKKKLMDKCIKEQVGVLALPNAEVTLIPLNSEVIDKEYVREVTPEAVTELPSGFRLQVKYTGKER